jgi:hypothetical protein
MAGIPEGECGEHLIQDLDMSFMWIDSRGHIMPKTPGYLLAIPEHPYIKLPRASLYQTAMADISVIGEVLEQTFESSPNILQADSRKGVLYF